MSFSDRDAAALRMWRNHFISERTAYFCDDGMEYEEARAHAEARANKLETVLFDAMDRLEDKQTTQPAPAPNASEE